MSDISKPAHGGTEAISEKPRKRGFAGHCARFWWAYLVGVIVIVVIVVPVVILVAVPKIAQSKLDDAELQLDSIIMTEVKPRSFKMQINNVIRSDGKVHAKIDPFPGAMYLEEGDKKPFAVVNFPQTTSDAFQIVNVTQETKIDDLEAFTNFNKKLLSSDEFEVTVEGDTGVRVKGIDRRYGVTFKKTLKMAGLQTFAGLEVFNTTVELTKDEDGNNFFGYSRIPNRSIVTFEVGNATFDTFLLGQKVGQTFLDNLFLKPGNDNVFAIRGSVDQATVIKVLQQKPYCDELKGVLPFELVGANVTNHGEYLSYFADALAAGKQKVNIDLRTPITKAMHGTVLGCRKNQ